MASWQLELQPPPRKRTALELWLQHAAGRILVEDVRAYAIAKIEPGLPRKARAAAKKAIDDALYGLMMVIDGVSGGIASDKHSVELAMYVRLVDRATSQPIKEMNLADGDGMCMGYHGWLRGEFGEQPIAVENQK